MSKHWELLCKLTGGQSFKLMPAKRWVALGVGHFRRRGLEPGSKSDELAEVKDTEIVELCELEWRVLVSLKREFTPEEIRRDLWPARADDAGVSLDTFYEVARSLNARKVVGR